MSNAVELYRDPGEQARGLVPAGQPDPRDGSSDTLDLRALMDALRRRRTLMVTVFVSVILLTVLVMLILTPQYTATSQVVIDMRLTQVTPPTEQILSTQLADQSTITDTEIQVIQSSELAESVDTALQLDASPMFDPNIKSTGISAFIRSLIIADKVNPRTYDKAAQHTYVIGQLKRNLTVMRVGTTYSIQISYSSPDPVFSLRVANEYARQYARLQSEQKSTANQKAAAVLRDRLAELARRADADTRAVQEYRIRNNLLSTNAQSLTEQEVATYDTQLAAARAQAAEDASRLATAERQQLGGSVGEATTSPVVAALRTQRAQTAASLANLQAHYGPAYPDVVKLQGQLADIDASIRKETQSLIQEFRARSNVSGERLDSIVASNATAKGVLSGNNQSMIAFEALELKEKASQTLYDTYLARYKETAAQEGTETSQARVVSWGDMPAWPSTPNLIIMPLLGFLVAVGASIATAIIAELLFAGLTTGNEVEERLGLPYLGGIPANARWTRRGFLLRRNAQPGDKIVREPMSAFAESFRHLRTTINFVAQDREQVVMMASALPREGKSTAAFCLARSIGSRGARVLLIDCDLRRRTLNARSPDTSRPGLVEVLRSEVALDNAMVVDEETGAMMLPINDTDVHDGSVLVGGEMEDLLKEARARFDVVILDTPPILAVTETRILATLVDIVVVIVRWRKTPDHAVRTALRMLPSGRAHVAGVVLSRINMRKQARFGYGDAHGYYNQYKSYFS